MIIGLSTLIAILFFGGINETFLIDKLEKGVKQYVVDKERKKEITADLKAVSKYIKSYNKERKNQFKHFKEMNLNRGVTQEEMKEFFEDLMKSRADFQNKVIGDRLRVTAKLGPGEWDSIMVFSQQSVMKSKEKAEKKASKGKMSNPFAKTYQAIEDNVNDGDKREKMKKALDTFILAQNESIEQLQLMNSADNDLLTKRNASREELFKMAENMNVFREKAFKDLTDLHFSFREQTKEKEWESIMKSFNKELTITAH